MEEEGVCAVALGLRALAEDTAGSMIQKADHIGISVNQTFMDEFFPLSLDQDQEILWKDYGNYQAKELFEINYIEPLIKYLKL